MVICNLQARLLWRPLLGRARALAQKTGRSELVDCEQHGSRGGRAKLPSQAMRRRAASSLLGETWLSVLAGRRFPRGAKNNTTTTREETAYDTPAYARGSKEGSLDTFSVLYVTTG